MPTYELPPEKKETHEDMPMTDSPDHYRRTVSFPVNAEILEAVEIGGEVHVELLGEVTEIRSNEGSEYEDRSISVIISSVKVYGAEEEAEEGFARGFGKVRRMEG